MPIERITLLTDGQGFTVGCLSCKSRDHQGVGALFTTDQENFMGSVLASNAAQVHEVMHPDHHIVIFSYQRKQ